MGNDCSAMREKIFYRNSSLFLNGYFGVSLHDISKLESEWKVDQEAPTMSCDIPFLLQGITSFLARTSLCSSSVYKPPTIIRQQHIIRAINRRVKGANHHEISSIFTTVLESKKLNVQQWELVWLMIYFLNKLPSPLLRPAVAYEILAVFEDSSTVSVEQSQKRDSSDGKSGFINRSTHFSQCHPNYSFITAEKLEKLNQILRDDSINVPQCSWKCLNYIFSVVDMFPVMFASTSLCEELVKALVRDLGAKKELTQLTLPLLTAKCPLWANHQRLLSIEQEKSQMKDHKEPRKKTYPQRNPNHFLSGDNETVTDRVESSFKVQQHPQHHSDPQITSSEHSNINMNTHNTSLLYKSSIADHSRRDADEEEVDSSRLLTSHYDQPMGIHTRVPNVDNSAVYSDVSSREGRVSNRIKGARGSVGTYGTAASQCPTDVLSDSVSAKELYCQVGEETVRKTNHLSNSSSASLATLPNGNVIERNENTISVWNSSAASALSSAMCAFKRSTGDIIHEDVDRVTSKDRAPSAVTHKHKAVGDEGREINDKDFLECENDIALNMKETIVNHNMLVERMLDAKKAFLSGETGLSGTGVHHERDHKHQPPLESNIKKRNIAEETKKQSDDVRSGGDEGFPNLYKQLMAKIELIERDNYQLRLQLGGAMEDVSDAFESLHIENTRLKELIGRTNDRAFKERVQTVLAELADSQLTFAEDTGNLRRECRDLRECLLSANMDKDSISADVAAVKVESAQVITKWTEMEREVLRHQQLLSIMECKVSEGSRKVERTLEEVRNLQVDAKALARHVAVANDRSLGVYN